MDIGEMLDKFAAWLDDLGGTVMHMAIGFVLGLLVAWIV